MGLGQRHQASFRVSTQAEPYFVQTRRPVKLPHVLLALLTAVLLLPVLGVLASWLPLGDGGAQSAQILGEMRRTVLPGYVWTTLLLCLLVGAGVMAVGLSTAAAVTLFDFPGRRIFEWALLLPLAMPAYVVAYAYTDFLQFSGPLQSLLRDVLGVQGRVFPEVRSLGGAVWVFTFVLYPYVYLLARAPSRRAASIKCVARSPSAARARR